MLGPDENQHDLREALALLVGGASLSEPQAWQAFETVMAGLATEAQIGALLAILSVRPGGPTTDEITGAAKAMRNHAMRVEAPAGIEVIDTCGTGGDRSGTFNISTCAALIAAGAGVYIAKHGNRSVTGVGSSQVLEALGVRLECTREVLVRSLEEARICFCFAPAHHPAMKHVAGPRQQLGFRTIFNLLGPLTNPAGARRQVIGVYAPQLTDTIARVLLRLGTRHAMVVHGRANGAGIDELTTTGTTHISVVRDGKVASLELTPGEVGLAPATLRDLRVANLTESADVVRRVLAGEPGPARDIAALNAAAAIVVASFADDLVEGLQRARESIDSGAAARALEQLVHITNHG
jgi:anthranilate phosphoribosyltransferase